MAPALSQEHHSLQSRLGRRLYIYIVIHIIIHKAHKPEALLQALGARTWCPHRHGHRIDIQRYKEIAMHTLHAECRSAMCKGRCMAVDDILHKAHPSKQVS